MSSVVSLLMIILLLAPFVPQCSARHLRTGANDHLRLSEDSEKASSFDESATVGDMLPAKRGRTRKEAEETGAGSGIRRRRSLLQGSWNHHVGFDVDYVGPRTHSPSHN